MTEIKFTLGPWATNILHDGIGILSVDKKLICGLGPVRNPQEIEPNFNLISASPDMFMVIKSLLDALSDGKVELRPASSISDRELYVLEQNWIDAWSEQACNAIDKALGEDADK